MTRGALVAVLVVLAMSTRSVFSATYTVIADGGCSDRWVAGCIYTSWAANKKFVVDDVLVFNFDNETSNVALVSSTEYYDCENGLISVPSETSHESPAKVPLDLIGDYYFTSVDDTRCYQKFQITVEYADTPTTPTTTTTTTASRSTSSKSTSSKSRRKGKSSPANGIVGALVAYLTLLGSVSLTVYCVVQRRKQRQMLAQLQGQPNLQDETSPALFADGQYDVEVNEQGEYVANDQPPGHGLRFQEQERSMDQLGRIG